jgi:hypothetical protein
MKYASKRCAPADAGRSREILQQDCTSLHRPGRDSQPDAPVAALTSIGGITDIPVL